MKTLIVDDEPIARHVLREALEPLSDVEVVGEADNGRSALALIHKLQPELVFLDLQMPVMSGFEVVRNLAAETTAHHRHRHGFRPARHSGVRGRGHRLSAEAGAGGTLAEGRGARPQPAPQPLKIANQVARIAAAAEPPAGPN